MDVSPLRQFAPCMDVSPARRFAQSRVGTVGGGWGFMSTDAYFGVKIGFKFQSLGKISNISSSDPQFFLGYLQHCSQVQYYMHVVR